MPELLDRWPMRQVAHFCLTLAPEKAPKSPLFDSFLAQNQPQMLQRSPQNAADATNLAATRRTPGQSPSPPASLRTIDREHGFPRSHGPAEDIVKHQMVNAWLTLLRMTAAGADEKFGGISGASRSCPKGSVMARCDRWRIFASLCVILAAQRRRNCRFSTAFWPKTNGQIAAGARQIGSDFRAKGRAPPVRSQPSADVIPHCPPQGFPLSSWSCPPFLAARQFAARERSVSLCPRPPASPCHPAIRGHGVPRSHGPAEDIVNHQMVNARLMSYRPAVRRGGCLADTAVAPAAARVGAGAGGALLRHFAPLWRPKRRRNRRFSSPFWSKIGGRIAKAVKNRAGAKA